MDKGPEQFIGEKLVNLRSTLLRKSTSVSTPKAWLQHKSVETNATEDNMEKHQMITRPGHQIQLIFLKFAISLACGLLVCALPSFAADSGQRRLPETKQKTSSSGIPADNATNPISPDPSTQDSGNEPPPLTEDQKDGHSFLTVFEQWLTLVILLFGALVLLAEYLLLKQTPKTSYELLQLFAVNLIITGTLVLISAGYSSSQIAPALGLFGTIAGYLLGRRSNSDEAPKDKDGAQKNPDRNNEGKETK